MSTLLFIITIIAVLVLLIKTFIKLFSRGSIVPTLRIIAVILTVYALLWLAFSLTSKDKVVDLGTDVCFDDWCATVIKVENPETLGNGNNILHPRGRFIILHIRMSNRARGIAQKPSEPRVHIVDGDGHAWAYSEEGQKTLEQTIGKQVGIDHRLELHESLETQLVFDIPKEVQDAKALIEEGPPFITKILFPEDRKVFRCTTK